MSYLPVLLTDVTVSVLPVVDGGWHTPNLEKQHRNKQRDVDRQQNMF